MRALPGGGTERVELPATAPRAAATADDACITDAQAVALAALGRRVEAHFGVPQDIEWALDDAGTIWLTQARPITSLYPVPPSRDGALRAFVCASLAQGLTRPITPMGLAAFGVIGGTLARLFGLPGPHATDLVAPPPAFAAVGARAFVDVTAVLRNPLGRAVAPRVLERHGGPYRRGAARPVRRSRVRPGARGPAAGPAPDRAGARAPPRAAGHRAGDRLPHRRPPPRRPHRRPRRRRSRLPAGRHPGRAGGSRDRGARDGRGGVPPQRTGLRGRLPHAGGRAPAGRGGPGRRHDGRRAARAAAQRHHGDGPAAVGAGAAGARGPGVGRRAGAPTLPISAPSPRGSTPATFPPSSRTGSPRSCAATATGPSPRSTSACPAGPSSPSTCSARWPTTCGCAPPRTGTRTPHPTPGSPPASGWRSRRSPTSSPGSGAAPGGARGPSGSPSAGCARWSGCARPPRTTSSG